MLGASLPAGDWDAWTISESLWSVLRTFFMTIVLGWGYRRFGCYDDMGLGWEVSTYPVSGNNLVVMQEADEVKITVSIKRSVDSLI